MNQILISEKLYITPELKKKKKMYKIDFFISVFLVCILFSYYIYAEYDKNKNEAISQEILSNIEFKDNIVDDTTIKFSDNSIIVVLNSDDSNEVNYSNPIVQEDTNIEDELIERNESVAPSGQKYHTVAIINIPSIGVNYPILNTTTDEFLKISPCYFWGPKPNEVGNYCIAGHNYRNTKFFSKVPNLENGDIIEITDMMKRTLKYSVYDKYLVDPKDASCTSQRTGGKKEITLITCTNDNAKRVVVKAREVEV